MSRTGITNKAGQVMRKQTYRQLIALARAEGKSVAEATDYADHYQCPANGQYDDTVTDTVTALVGVTVSRLSALLGSDLVAPVADDLADLAGAVRAKATTAVGQGHADTLAGGEILTGRYGSVGEALEMLGRGETVVVNNRRHSSASWWLIGQVGDLVRIVTVSSVRGHYGDEATAWVVLHTITVTADDLATYAEGAETVTDLVGVVVRHDTASRVKVVRSCGCPASPRGVLVRVADLANYHGDGGRATVSLVMAGRRLASLVLDRLTDETTDTGAVVRQWVSALPFVAETYRYADEVGGWHYLAGKTATRDVITL
jgi:hypothetical protein